jgi:type IV pilus assembly protein PilX
MNRIPSRVSGIGRRPARQRGAALFIALMILIVLSLLAVSAGQVTALQERMASAYWTDMRTFESSEAIVRQTERNILAAIDGAAIAEFEDPCASATREFDPVRTWSSNWTPPATGYQMVYENISRGASSRGSGNQGSIGAGQIIEGVDACSKFRVSVVRADDPTTPTSRAIVQTTFVQ